MVDGLYLIARDGEITLVNAATVRSSRAAMAMCEPSLPAARPARVALCGWTCSSSGDIPSSARTASSGTSRSPAKARGCSARSCYMRLSRLLTLPASGIADRVVQTAIDYRDPNDDMSSS